MHFPFPRFPPGRAFLPWIRSLNRLVLGGNLGNNARIGPVHPVYINKLAIADAMIAWLAFSEQRLPIVKRSLHFPDMLDGDYLMSL